MDDEFERLGPFRKAIKVGLIDPLANYLPASWLRALLRYGQSELAAANWTEPGGWRSMVISYGDRPRQLADRILVGSGTVSMALRNRFRLATRIIREIIDSSCPTVHVLCLGAGPGQIILHAMASASVFSKATLVDRNTEPFAFGRESAAKQGLAERVRFIEGDVRDKSDVSRILDHAPDMVKMIGICEYLTDGQIVETAGAVAAVMPSGAPIVFNNITRRHGSDRFLSRVLGLQLTYRSEEELTALMRRAGFGGFEVHAEPLGVYNVIVGRRQGG